MKVTFYKNIKTMSGKCPNGNMVFGSYKNHTVCIVRNFVYPTLTENNELAGLKMKAAAQMWKNLSLDFILDLKRYATAFNHQHLDDRTLPLTAYNIFIMGICKYQEPITDINMISSLLGLDLNSWITNGYLKKVAVSTPFNATVV